MKFSARVKFAAAGALIAAALMAGSAWASEATVRSRVTAYGLSYPAGETGSTITVTGSVRKPASELLNLGDLTGLTVDWQADLTVTGGERPGKGYGMINFTNGTFRMTKGTLQLPSGGTNWVDGICADGAATITITGTAALRGSRATDTGISMEEGTLNLESGGTIDIPSGNAVFAKTFNKSADATMRGVAITVPGDGTAALTAYGHVTTTAESELFYNPSDFDEEDAFTSVTYVASSGSTWDITGVTSDMTNIDYDAHDFTIAVDSLATMNLKNSNLKFPGTFVVASNGTLNVGVANGDSTQFTHVKKTAVNSGIINIYGTLTNLDAMTNEGIINNYSNTFDNRGTLTNRGRLTNQNSGALITNSGTIVNSGGTIDVASGTFRSSQSKESMGGAVQGDIEPLLPGDSGSGCNAGFGLAALLLAGLALRKRA